MNDIVMDFNREQRCGVTEAVFCQYKSPTQISEIVTLAEQQQQRLLLTRLAAQKWQALPAAVQQRLNYQAAGATAMLGELPELQPAKQIAIVSAGSSDHAVCSEIAATLNFHGFGCQRFEDVGVSALWRLQARLAELQQSKIIIAVAGMEAALPTVLCGMVSQPIIAVPTSVGYGVSEGGNLALNAMLGSCAAGLTVVNIDNGFGAACAAIRMMKMWQNS